MLAYSGAGMAGYLLQAKGPAGGGEGFPIPAEKGLSAAWRRSLIERGEPGVARGKELRWIGMPVGGIGCGQVYLGGDGKLWLWDVLNLPCPAGFDSSAGPHYERPLEPSSPFQFGFALHVERRGGGARLPFGTAGFGEIEFRGTYPIGTVTYRSTEPALEVVLEAFSPYAPLELEASSLPATVLHFTVRNTGAAPLAVTLLGNLDNPVAHSAGEEHGDVLRTTYQVRDEALGMIVHYAESQRSLEALGDFGTMALAVLGPGAEALLSLAKPSPAGEIDPRLNERATVARRLELAPGGTGEAVFVVAWHFPNLLREKLSFLTDIEKRKRHYAATFPTAEAVARYVGKEYPGLAAMTRGWRDTWYDSSLPHWLLERTFASVSTLATSTCFRLDDGRFYATEGAHCCPGTCTHVWQYAQAAARLFPALERDQRERVDLGLAFHEDSGQIDYRAEAARELAVDGQAGTILRVWREHTCSPDDAFLRRVYPRAKKALECLLARDADHDGILDGAQYNTLDAAWYGAIPWLSSLYLAAVRAGEAMAEELGDGLFAARCRSVLAAGAKALVERCFDGEYFVQRLDPAHPEANATGTGCAIDQVYGQAWAHQVGLGRILPERETRAALGALWKYNFAPDVGPYREYMRDKIPGGRWFAMPGEAGLLMCTWPKGGHEVAAGSGPGPAGGDDSWAAGYSNECMTGFEHQVAAHMLWEGMVEKGLAIERAIHDRYHPAKRNPFNEVECGDHYARAMASYGVYLAVCGFELHGPKGHIGFVPRLGPDRFRAAFTAAEGWGTYTQEIAADKTMRALLELRYGRLRLRTLRIGHAALAEASRAEVRLGERVLACTLEREPISFLLRFSEDVLVGVGEALAIECRA